VSFVTGDKIDCLFLKSILCDAQMGFPNSLSNIGKIYSTILGYILMGINTKVKAERERSK
jgi:hypothetical protein